MISILFRHTLQQSHTNYSNNIVEQMQTSYPEYWKEMDLLNRDSKIILSQNQSLQKTLEILNKQIQFKDSELYNIETRLENLDIFEQHLTSLNLRCEFLDKQVLNLENKIKIPSYSTNINTPLQGMKEFKDRSNKMSNSIKIEWKTTETTLENLCTEFSYLKEQLSIANNNFNLDYSIMDESNISHNSTTDKSNSLFSDQELPSMDETYNNTSNILNYKSSDDNSKTNEYNNKIKDDNKNNSNNSINSINSNNNYIDNNNNNNKNNNNKNNNNNIRKKKKLLKMESFLNFADNLANNDSIIDNNHSDNEIVPLRGFKINSMNENPLFDNKSTKKKKIIKDKSSIRSIRKKLKLIDLPAIDEEEFNLQSEYENETEIEIKNNVLEIMNEENEEYHELSIGYDKNLHRRHNSLPENSSLDGNNLILSSDESIRHFTSYETGLNSKFNHKKFNVTDFLFEKSSNFDKLNNQNNLLSSSPFSTFKASYIDNESYYGENNLTKHEKCNEFYSKSDTSLLLDSDSSDESYGDENVTPLILKKESKLSLYRCNSHESIFSTINDSKSIRKFPLREKNLDLKAQTMKWLKPNIPLVSSSTQYSAQPSKVSNHNNAHDDIINILQSGNTLNENISTPSTPKKTSLSASNTPFSQQKSSSSCKIPISSPMQIHKKTDISESNTSDAPISSWFSSLIPNSAFTNPEIGKFIGQPSGVHFNNNENEDKSFKSNSFNNKVKNTQSSFTLAPINFRKVKSNINGPSSSLTIHRNGEKIITHGYGSGFNNNNVISSRVSHGALREALENDMNF